MKAFTDIEQSKKLAEILPLESADCCYIKYCTSDNNEWRYEGQPPFILGEIPITEITAEHIPCWSLAALLGVYPMIVGRDMDMYCCWQNSKNLHSRHYDNPVDACVEMLELLHKKI